MSKRKLLLADDSVTIQKVVNLTFADEGVEVIAVGNGDAAMELIDDSAPDVILADVHMPGLNGYQICERVRQNPETRGLPVVLLVGSFEPFDEEEAERVGANSYLTKPFQSIRQLVSQVTDLMEASEQAADESAVVVVPDEVADVVAEPAEKPVETLDIDSLYQRSFGAPVPISEPVSDVEESEPEQHQFSDVGMDDDMIETISAAVEPVQEEHYTADEPAAYSAAEVGYQSNDPWSAPVDQYDLPTDRYPTTEFTLSEAEPATGEFQEEETTFDRQDGPSYVDQLTSSEQIPRQTAEFSLDEIELLELPPIENGKTLEFTMRDIELGSDSKEVVSLSPALMDALVEKVVQRLSEKQ